MSTKQHHFEGSLLHTERGKMNSRGEELVAVVLLPFSFLCFSSTWSTHKNIIKTPDLHRWQIFFFLLLLLLLLACQGRTRRSGGRWMSFVVCGTTANIISIGAILKARQRKGVLRRRIKDSFTQCQNSFSFKLWVGYKVLIFLLLLPIHDLLHTYIWCVCVCMCRMSNKKKSRRDRRAQTRNVCTGRKDWNMLHRVRLVSVAQSV